MQTVTTIYLKLDKNMKITGKTVHLNEIAQIFCSDRAVEARAKMLCFPTTGITGSGRYVFSVMDVIEVLQKEIPSAEVTSLGESDFVLTFEEPSDVPVLCQWGKTAIVCAITFFGAAFSIMAFNNDVGVTKLFAQIYELFTGETSNGFTVLEASYSVGLGVGILIYFNHFGKKKMTADPTPLEIEMRLYEDQINDTLIEGDSRSAAPCRKKKRGEAC